MSSDYLFISHANADNDSAKRLTDQLKALTPRAYWIDDYDLKPPIPDWDAALDKAVKASAGGVLLLSRRILDRPNVTAEWRYLLDKHPTAFYMAKLDDISDDDIPIRLRLVQYVDLSADWDAGIAALAAAINGEAATADAPVFHPPRITGSILSERLTMMVKMSGRDEVLKQVRDGLPKQTITVLGIGGLGKSRLAAEIATTSDSADGTIWHVASETSSADEVLIQMRDHFGLPNTTDRPEIIAKVGKDRLLVVIDNAESVSAGTRRQGYVGLITELRGKGARVLLTSRVRWNELKARAVDLNKLDPAAAAAVVNDMRAALDVKPDLMIDAAAFAKAARYHPRLIELGLSQLWYLSPESAIRELKSLKSEDAQDALFEMIGKTVDAMIAAHGEDKLTALRKLNVCRGGFTEDAAQAITGLDESALMGVLKVLVQYGFIGFGAAGERYTIDPLVVEAVGIDDAVRRVHYDYYFALARQHNDTQTYYLLAPEHANLEAAFEWALPVDPLAAYRLASACSFYLANRGRWEQRMAWFESVATLLAAHPDEALRANVQTDLS